MHTLVGDLSMDFHTFVSASRSIFLMSGSSSLVLSLGRYCRSSGSLSVSSSGNSSGPARGRRREGRMSASSPSSHWWQSASDGEV